MKKTDITIERLIDDGWVKNEGDEGIMFAMEKSIPNTNPINNTQEDTDIKLVIHRMFNSTNFAVLFPDGGMLNFVANTMSELHEFEDKITFYDCPF